MYIYIYIDESRLLGQRRPRIEDSGQDPPGIFNLQSSIHDDFVNEFVNEFMNEFRNPFKVVLKRCIHILCS